jgi:isoquinoline 1-oxidoreductase subunit beta
MDSSTALMGRRQFLGTAATGFTLGFSLLSATESHAAAGDTAVNTWLTVGTDNTITLTIGSSDMGQGSSAGLAQILCEDLMVDYTRVWMVQGSPTTAAVAPVGASISTVGSGVIRNNFWRLRDAAASARETLILAAMGVFADTTRSHYTVSNGVVRHSSGATRTYGQLAAAAPALTPVVTLASVDTTQFKQIGQPLPRLDIPAKVTGAAKYGLDVRLPNMVFAVIKHCPTVGGTLKTTPATPAGALAVVPVKIVAGAGRAADVAGNTNAVAVVAPTTWDAMRLANALTVAWTLPAAASSWNSTQFLADANALALNAPPYVAGAVANQPGALYTAEKSTADPATALAGSARKLEATYTLPFVPHACMEVLNCTVDFVAGVRCHVHAPTQVAKSALVLAMAMTGLPESQVKIFTTQLGGGLGRKAEIDFIGQAIQVGMALQRPVQLVWPREQDFTHGQYRPMAVVRARAGLDNNNWITSWLYRNVSPSIMAQRGSVLGAAGDSQGTEGSHHLPYAFGSRLVEWVNQPTPIPVGFWRSVGASINAFAVESMLDELAALAKQDPYQFRKRYLTDPRWMAVLDAAAALGNWSAPSAPGTAKGIAISSAFNSVVATVVEVSGTSVSNFKVTRVSVVIDSYLTVNPRNVEAQLSGGVVHGLNATLYGQQTFANGAAQRSNFNTNPVLRLSAMPVVAVQVMPMPATLDRNAKIGGVGELGVPTVAPALANAVFRLCGTRQRSLPFFPAATMGGL